MAILIHCSICGKPQSVRKENNNDPPEAEECERCMAKICIDCVDWDYQMDFKTSEIVCRKCTSRTYE